MFGVTSFYTTVAQIDTITDKKVTENKQYLLLNKQGLTNQTKVIGGNSREMLRANHSEGPAKQHKAYLNERKAKTGLPETSNMTKELCAGGELGSLSPLCRLYLTGMPPQSAQVFCIVCLDEGLGLER